MFNKINVIFSSHLSNNEDDKFINHIKDTIGVVCDVFCYKNYNEFSLTQIYNRGYNEHIEDNTIFVFCHNDITFKTSNWGKILLKKFNNSDYDILGVAGSTFIGENGVWWTDRSKMHGCVEHTNGISNWVSSYSNERVGMIVPVVLIDGLFMAFKPDENMKPWNEDFNSFHFYDVVKCVENYLDGFNIGVINDIRILHQSIGQTNDKWEENRIKFINQYGNNLPIDINDYKIKNIND
jgi:hypothetical protein